MPVTAIQCTMGRKMIDGGVVDSIPQYFPVFPSNSQYFPGNTSISHCPGKYKYFPGKCQPWLESEEGFKSLKIKCRMNEEFVTHLLPVHLGSLGMCS